MAVFSNGVAGMVLFKIGKNMYNPLPDGVTIKQSPIHGFGLYASERITKGTIIGITHHVNPNVKDGVIRTPLGGFGNHSDTPNCFKMLVEETTWMIGANEDIDSGEELTWKYTIYNPQEEEKMTNEEERHLNMTIKVLKEQVEIFTSRLQPHDTGHLHTAISVLTHRIEELKK